MAFLQIISDNILPLLVFVAIGYFLDRRFTLNVTFPHEAHILHRPPELYLL